MLSTQTAPDDSAAVTLMATDIDRISSSLENLHEVWALSIEVIIGTYLLERQVGWVCVAPLILVVRKYHVPLLGLETSLIFASLYDW